MLKLRNWWRNGVELMYATSSSIRRGYLEEHPSHHELIVCKSGIIDHGARELCFARASSSRCSSSLATTITITRPVDTEERHLDNGLSSRYRRVPRITVGDSLELISRKRIRKHAREYFVVSAAWVNIINLIDAWNEIWQLKLQARDYVTR